MARNQTQELGGGREVIIEAPHQKWSSSETVSKWKEKWPTSKPRRLKRPEEKCTQEGSRSDFHKKLGENEDEDRELQ